MKEYILCAANHYDDKKKHTHTPKNIESGFVICGRRHRNCISIFAQLMKFHENGGYSEEAMEINKTVINGFLTNTDRFVDRKEAYKIAFEADQIIGPNKGYRDNSIGLTSEDLY